jgi:membrane protein
VKAKTTANRFLLLLSKRLFSVAFILGIGFLLLVSLVVSAVLAALAGYLQRFDTLGILLPVANAFVSFAVVWALFAALIKFMPDVRLAWKDVLPGSALTALLFVIGKSLLGWYLGQKDAVSAYGIAGSLIIMLLWINYSSQVFLFGVEFTKAYTLRSTGKIVPKGYAEVIHG